MYYIGIDVHSKKCMTTIKGRTKDILKQTEFNNDVQGINGFIKMVRQEGYVPATAVCESTGNYWIVPHDMLEEAGINTLLAHPHNTKIITQTVYKNDKADSEKLADLCRLDMVPESFVANKAQRDLRELTRTRLELQDETSGPKNRIHAILAKYPHKRPVKGLFTDRGLEWLQNVPLRDIDRMAVQAHLATLATISGQVLKFERKIAGIAMNDNRARLIMTIPGIGYITAVTILAEIVDHKRFANAEKLVSYAGLSPKHHNSGDTVRMGGITKRGSVWLRKAMVEAAFVAIRHDARNRGDLSKTGRPHRSHEGKGRHSQADARMGLGDARQRYRVQNQGQGVRQTEVPENKAHRRIPGLGHVAPWAGRGRRRGRLAAPAQVRGGSTPPLAPSGLPKYNIGSRRPARPPPAQG